MALEATAKDLAGTEPACSSIVAKQANEEGIASEQEPLLRRPRSSRSREVEVPAT